MSTAINVLTIEDNPGDLRLIQEMLGEYTHTVFNLSHAADLESGHRSLGSGDIDVLLLDLGLPDSQGLETLTKTLYLFPDVPLIILSGLEDETMAIEAVRQGAQDYLVKDEVTCSLLVRSISYAIERKRAELALRASENFARATIDGLPAHIAILDDQGIILAVNRAWRRYAEANPPVLTNLAVGANYLAVCEAAEGPFSEGARRFAQGIRSVLAGKVVQFQMEYPCHSPHEQHWFVGHVTPFAEGKDPSRVIVAHEEITERKLAEEGIGRNEARLRSLVSILQYDADSTQTLLDYALEEAISLTESKIGYIYYYHEDRQQFILNTWSKGVMDQCTIVNPPTVYDLAKTGAWGEVVRQRRPIIMNDFKAEHPFKKGYPARHAVLHNWMSVPVFSGDQIVAVVGVANRETNYTAVEMLQLTLLMDSVWKMVERKQIQEKLEHRNDYLAALHEITMGLLQKLDLDKLLDVIMPRAAELAGTPHGFVDVVDEEAHELRMAAAVGKFTAHLGMRTPHGTGASGQAWESAQTVHIEDYHVYENKLAEFEWLSAIVSIPLQLGNQVIGVIGLGYEQPHKLAQDEIEDLEQFADLAALALQNARLYAEVQHHAHQLEEHVTERTAELRQSKERLQAILNSHPDAVLLLNLDGLIETANPAFHRLFDYKMTEIYGSPPDSLIAPADVRKFSEGLNSVITGGDVSRFECIAVRKDGGTFDAELQLAPVRNSKVVGFVCNIRDITKIKGAERLKDEFVSNVSHELRTPITGIKLNHSLLKMSPDRPEIYLDRLGREVDRLNQLIEDLLRLSRLDQDRVELKMAPSDLNSLAHQYVNDRAAVAESRGLSLQLGESVPLPSVPFDPGLVGQVISILLTNAMNYTPAGGRITVHTMMQENREESWCGISVSDTGPGIEPAEQSRLFERFYRGKAGIASKAPGTGLGLSIAKEIASRHGGHMEVLSKGVPGEGSTFTLWLPISNNR